MPSPELYARWMQTGLLTPFCWTHSAGPGNLEPWAFGNRLEEISRNSIELRYQLFPYIYTAFWEASETGVPIMRPLLLEFLATRPRSTATTSISSEMTCLWLPSPRTTTTSRAVYLPRGVWYDFWSGPRYDGPTEIEAAAPMERIPLFVRGGAIIPSQQAVQYTDQAPIDPFTFDVYPAGVSSRSYYEDDGISFDYMHGVYLLRQITAHETEKGVRVELGAPEGTYAPAKRSLVIKVHAQLTEPAAVSDGGSSLPRLTSADALAKADAGWRYDADERIVWVKIPDREAATEVDVAR